MVYFEYTLLVLPGHKNVAHFELGIHISTHNSIHSLADLIIEKEVMRLIEIKDRVNKRAESGPVRQ